MTKVISIKEAKYLTILVLLLLLLMLGGFFLYKYVSKSGEDKQAAPVENVEAKQPEVAGESTQVAKADPSPSPTPRGPARGNVAPSPAPSPSNNSASSSTGNSSPSNSSNNSNSGSLQPDVSPIPAPSPESSPSPSPEPFAANMSFELNGDALTIVFSTNKTIEFCSPGEWSQEGPDIVVSADIYPSSDTCVWQRPFDPTKLYYAFLRSVDGEEVEIGDLL